MADEATTLLGKGESLTKSQAIDELLNVNAPEEASEDVLEPNAEMDEVEQEETLEEAEEVEATSEDDFDDEDAVELSDSDDEDDDEEYEVDASEVMEVEDEDTYYTVKVDGEERQVKADELVKSYQLEQAAQKRMQEAAELRKNSEVEMQTLAQQREQYAQALEQLNNQLNSVEEPTQEYWDKLYAEDPMGYMRQREAHRERKDALQQVQVERQRVQQESAQQAQVARQQYLADENEKLLSALPEWSDPEVANAEKQAIITYAQRNLGFSDEEVANISDSRGVLALRKAYLYDELMAKKPEAQKKVKKAPKVTRSGKPATKAQANAKRGKKALERLNKTGSKDAAVDLLLERMRS
jgi:hypothetical protein